MNSCVWKQLNKKTGGVQFGHPLFFAVRLCCSRLVYNHTHVTQADLVIAGDCDVALIEV